MKIGKKLRFFRYRAGLTQKELAEKSKTVQMQISRYEANTMSPQPHTLTRLAKALGCSTTELLEDAGS